MSKDILRYSPLPNRYLGKEFHELEVANALLFSNIEWGKDSPPLYEDNYKLAFGSDVAYCYNKRLLYSVLFFNKKTGDSYIQPFYRSSGYDHPEVSPEGTWWPTSGLWSRDALLDAMRVYTHFMKIPQHSDRNLRAQAAFRLFPNGWIGKHYIQPYQKDVFVEYPQMKGLPQQGYFLPITERLEEAVFKTWIRRVDLIDRVHDIIL